MHTPDQPKYPMLSLRDPIEEPYMQDSTRSPSALETSRKQTSSVHDINADKPPFGSRFLTDEAEVWSQNAWDHVPPPDDQMEIIAASLAKQRVAPVPEDQKLKYNEKPSRHWDNFYKMNSSNFFRNRKWLHNEFPELVAAAEPDAGPITIAEIGCGAGNAVFPLLSANKNPELTLRAYDYSTHAVKLVQTNPLYISPPIGTIHAAVWDLSSTDTLPQGVEPGTVDIIILVFVISALHPDEWGRAIANIHKMLKPGGLVVFRDYGRHDLTQLRFKAGRLLDDNFYIRGDKTRVYFFELDELSLLFTGSPSSEQRTKIPEVLDDAESDESTETFMIDSTDPASSFLPGIIPHGDAPPSDTPPRSSTPSGFGPHLTSQRPKKSSNISTGIHPSLLSSLPDSLPHPLFTTEQLGVDRRLLVNRKRQLKMYRVWMQGKFRKLHEPSIRP